MKIAITVEALKNEYFAGVEQYIYNLTCQLVNRGELDLTLIAPSDFPRSLFPGNTNVIYHTPALVLGSGFFFGCFFPAQKSFKFRSDSLPYRDCPIFFSAKRQGCYDRSRPDPPSFSEVADHETGSLLQIFLEASIPICGQVYCR